MTREEARRVLLRQADALARRGYDDAPIVAQAIDALAPELADPQTADVAPIVDRIGGDLLWWADLVDDDGKPTTDIDELDEFAEIVQNSSIPEACRQIRGGMVSG